MDTTLRLIVYFSVSTLILLFGPNKFARLIPGLSDKLPLVDTRQGMTRGETWYSHNGRGFSVFRSIPYAKPPVGPRRFKLPQPLDEEDRFKTIRDYTAETSCIQPDLSGTEDCLTLNIYSPDISMTAGLPVIVYIHGGDFVSGDGRSTTAGPHFLMDQDLVLVTINYRLGVLGFISLENENMQGNQGLFDQRQALRWVKQNIKSFGGDPNLVTIMGSGAGGVSVAVHLTSPLSKGLFHRAILQGGSTLSNTLKQNRRPSYYSKKLGYAVGCADEFSLIGCLQNTALPQLMEKGVNMFPKGDNILSECSIRDDLGPWKPVSDSYAETSILPANQEAMLAKLADVPILIGFNQAEGLHFSTRLIKEPKLAERFVESMSTCGPINLFGLEESQITENDLEASNKLISSYNAIEGGQIQMEGFTDLMGDAVYGLSTHQFSEYLRVNNYTAYRYIYSHVGGYSLADTMSSSSTQFFINMLKLLVGVFESIGLGACHGDENLSLFSHFPWISYLVNEDDYSVKDNMNRWWANFAKYGDPNGKTKRKVSRGPENEGLTWEPVSFTSGRWDYWTISITPTMEERKDLKTRFQRWL